MATNQRKAGALLTYGYIFANFIVILLYQPIMMRILGQAEYGLYSLMLSVSGYLSVFDLGLGSAVVIFTVKYRTLGDLEAEKQLHGLLGRVFNVIALVVFALGTLITLLLPLFFSASLTHEELEKGRILMMIHTVNMSLTMAFTVYTNIIAAYERFVFAKVITIVKTLLGPAVMLPALLLGGRSIILSVILCAVNVICLFSNKIYCERELDIKVKYCGIDRIGISPIVSFALFIFIAELVDKVNWYVDQFILGVMKGTEEVAIHAYALNYNQLLLLLSATIAGVLQPKITSMVSRNCSKGELTGEMVKYSRIQIYPILLLITGFAILGYDFCIWHGGEGYGAAYYVFLALALGEVVSITQSVALAVIKAQNKLRFWSLLTLGAAVFNIIITIPLTKYFGCIGAAAGTGITFALANGLIMNIYYSKSAGLRMSAYWKDFVKMIVGFVPAAALTVLLKWALHLAPMAEFLICGIVLVILYSASAFIFVMNKYEKNLIYSLINKVIKKT